MTQSYADLADVLLTHQMYPQIRMLADKAVNFDSEKDQQSPADHVKKTLHHLFITQTIAAFGNQKIFRNKDFCDFVFNSGDGVGNPPPKPGYIPFHIQSSLFHGVARYILPFNTENELVSIFEYLWCNSQFHDNHFQFINITLLPSKWGDETLNHTITNKMLRGLVLPWSVDDATKLHPSYIKDAEGEYILDDILKTLLDYNYTEQVYFILSELTQDPTHGQALFDLILEISAPKFNKPRYLYTFVGQADLAKIKPFIDILIAQQNWDKLKPFLMHAVRALNSGLIEYILQHPQLGNLAESIKATSQPYNEVLTSYGHESQV